MRGRGHLAELVVIDVGLCRTTVRARPHVNEVCSRSHLQAKQQLMAGTHRISSWWPVMVTQLQVWHSCVYTVHLRAENIISGGVSGVCCTAGVDRSDLWVL